MQMIATRTKIIPANSFRCSTVKPEDGEDRTTKTEKKERKKNDFPCLEVRGHPAKISCRCEDSPCRAAQAFSPLSDSMFDL